MPFRPDMGIARPSATCRHERPGNSGVIFRTDILLPVFGFALLALARRA